MAGDSAGGGRPYRGRLAPSPTGRLHLGHARTFWMAQERARNAGGTLILRNDDLDKARCRPEFVEAVYEDLEWFGFRWDEGPDVGGPVGPYEQSQRRGFHVEVFARLLERGALYPCRCSRKDVLRALSAPHEGEEEPVYPGTCRPGDGVGAAAICDSMMPSLTPGARDLRDSDGARINWRFRAPEGEVVSFTDGGFGGQRFVAGSDFGDFVVWRGDDLPAYHLAVVADDHAMGVTEVVRGEDLLTSTARQTLVYRALDLEPPAYFHCPLMRDVRGERLAKRHDALSLRELREGGASPEALRREWLPDAPGA